MEITCPEQQENLSLNTQCICGPRTPNPAASDNPIQIEPRLSAHRLYLVASSLWQGAAELLKHAMRKEIRGVSA